MLCRTWLLGWDGLEDGALGAGGTGRFRVSACAEDTEADGGFWGGAGEDVGGGA